jgi:phosphorylcholine metabolism protein LicD
VLKFYQMAHATTRIMKKHGIWHIATGGTLLGAVRNQGIIPHDDDVDFSIFRNPGESIMDTAGFKADVVANGMYLHKVHQDFWKLKAKENPDRAVDIFGLVVLDSDTGVAEVKYDDNMWPRQSLPIKVMYGGALRMWKFGEIEVQGPQEDVAISHFNQAYGPDWNKTISCKGTNHVCVGVQDAEWDLHGRAMPTGPIEEPRWC